MLRDNHFPPKGYANYLYLPVPQELLFDDHAVRKIITEKLEHLSQWEIIPNDSWYIKIPLESRQTGGVKGGCFIRFKKEVQLEAIAMVKLLLSDTQWQDFSTADNQKILFRCHWAKSRELDHKFKNKTQPEQTNSPTGSRSPSDTDKKYNGFRSKSNMGNTGSHSRPKGQTPSPSVHQKKFCKPGNESDDSASVDQCSNPKISSDKGPNKKKFNKKWSVKNTDTDKKSEQKPIPLESLIQPVLKE
jgi:hypothetical protein